MLPQVLRQDEMSLVLADCEERALRELPPGQARAAALALRDAAVLELLYASAIRVSELCELDLGGLDQDRRTVRVLGKGGKERVVPVGVPALRAVAAGRRPGARAGATSAAGPRSSSGRGAAASTRGPRAASCTPG